MISVVTPRIRTIAERRAFLFELWLQKTLTHHEAHHKVAGPQQAAPPVAIKADPKELPEIQAIIDKFSDPESDRFVLEKPLC